VLSFGYHLLNGPFGVVAALLLKYQYVVCVSPLERISRVLVTDIQQLQIVELLSPLESLLGVVWEKCLISAIEKVVFQWPFPDFERPEVSCSGLCPENRPGFAGSIANIFLHAIYPGTLWLHKFFGDYQHVDLVQTIFYIYDRDVF